MNWFAYCNNNPLRFTDPTGLETREEYEQQELAQYKEAMGAPWWENEELHEETTIEEPEQTEVTIRALSDEEVQNLETDKWLRETITRKDAWLYDSLRFIGLKTGLIKRDDMGGYIDPFSKEYIPLSITQKKGISFIAEVGLALTSWGVANGPRMALGSKLSPADMARKWQGKGEYSGVDDWVNITLPKGTRVAQGSPGNSLFFTTENALQQVGNNATVLYDGLQVGKGAYSQFRPGVTVSELTQDTIVAYSRALANSQFGVGGLPQYYIPQVENLNPLYTILMRNR